MTPEEWRERVGQHLESRREEMGYGSRRAAAEGIDVSEPWIREIETGVTHRDEGPNPTKTKVWAYMDRLRWPRNAIERLLGGEDPADWKRKSREQMSPAERVQDSLPGVLAFNDMVFDMKRRLERVEQILSNAGIGDLAPDAAGDLPNDLAYAADADTPEGDAPTSYTSRPGGAPADDGEHLED